MSNKFKVGDKVVINKKCKRLPIWIKTGLKRLYRIRTIGAIFYYHKNQHTAYYLGSNKKGLEVNHYPFRAEMLKLYKKPKRTSKHRINKACLPIAITYNEQNNQCLLSYSVMG